MALTDLKIKKAKAKEKSYKLYDSRNRPVSLLCRWLMAGDSVHQG